jgi:hypothetical protein
VQETVYAILALNQLNHNLYLPNLLSGGAYLRAAQLPNGGWEDYTGSGQSNNVTGEAMRGLEAIPEPTAAGMLILGTVGFFCRRRRA